MRRLFGTDGIRGVAGQYPLDPKTVFGMGAELGNLLRSPNRPARVVVGRDTRASGIWIEDAVIDGLASSGVKADLAEIFTTPGISFLARTRSYQAGVVVSASHNPYQDNGIKIFSETGIKISDAMEEQIEARLPQGGADPAASLQGRRFAERLLAVDEPFERAYQDFLCQAADGRASRYKIVMDCANGAAFRIGPQALRQLGHEVVTIHDRPDGANINCRSGALHPEAVCQAVRAHRADFGIAFDGDADRSIFSDESGQVVDGDHILYVLACHLKRQGKLRGDRIVTTSMANMGLEVALRETGIALERTQVGDRHVLERMLQDGLNLGGEQSGHILLLDRSVAGDGILTAIELLNALQATGRKLRELASPVKKFPQVLLNVSVARKPDLALMRSVCDVVDDVRCRLGDQGRVVVRYSGTEPLARVMIEGRQESAIRDFARQIAQVIQDEIG